MHRSIGFACAAALALLLYPRATSGQAGSFTVMLGRDTVQVETFERSASRISGTVAFRSPTARFVRWVLELTADGTPQRYEQSLHEPGGAPIPENSANTTMVFERDSISRSTWRGGQVVHDRVAAPDGALPLLGASLSIPFANSWLTYELGHARGRTRARDGESAWTTIGPTQRAPGSTRVWLVGSDSVEADYFGLARTGFRFDRDGRLLRSDWTATTYKYIVTRGPPVDVEAIARGWGAQDAAGTGLGHYSPRDSVRATLAGATIWIAYGRPARRERAIWGGVVPWNQVWRLGADMATQLSTDVDLTVGSAVVPAGEYSLWMLPGEGEALLIVNRQTGQFGTQYDARQDLARLPMQRTATAVSVERLTLTVGEGLLRVEWGDAAYSVPVARR